MKRWRDVYRVLLVFVAAQPARLAQGAIWAALTVLAGMALLGLSGWFITATALAGLQTAAAMGFDVFTPSAGIRLLALGRTGARYGERLVSHDATFAALAQLRVRLFRGWARPDAARQLLVRPAKLLFRLTADIDALESLYLRLLLPAAGAFGAAVLAGLVLGSMRLWMGLALALWLVGAGWGIALWSAQRAGPTAVRRAHGLERLRARTVDLVAGQTELAMAGQLQVQRAALAAVDQQLAQADLTLNRLDSGTGMAYTIAGSVTLAAVLLAVGVLAEQGTIGAPQAALALLLALTATEPFGALRRGALEAGRTWLAARRLAPSLQAAPTAIRPDHCPDGWALRLSNATLAHPGSSVNALQAVSLHLQAGERVALVGPSGAGKSSLLALVAGELLAQHGSLQARSHSLLTQRTELFQDSLRDNLRLADAAADDVKLWQVLQTAGLADDVQALAAGLDTPLGEGGLGLSGGQSRRLALARLLLRDVDFWLLDEPTEALDAATAHDVLQRLQLQAAGKTILIATHLQREAALADRLVCVRDGRIDADLRRGTAAFDAALRALRPD
ncbi:amino acid ABC transporter ATP-binding/permease protein [Rhodoferax sp.]|uniref:amino acid ABC transporter ATP-binding/permease protein n=1 Tax=Rhodoferax sp. TaxID=50421 RepID=UPI00374DA8CD